MENRIDTLLTNAIYIRGSIINQTILLERLVDQFLARYFCSDSDRGNELLESLLCTERITFDHKKEVLFYIIEKVYPEFFKENKGFKTGIGDIIADRNLFAHTLLNMSQEIVADLTIEAGFIKFSKKHIPKNYTMGDIKKKLENIQEYIDFMDKILKVL